MEFHELESLINESSWMNVPDTMEFFSTKNILLRFRPDEWVQITKPLPENIAPVENRLKEKFQIDQTHVSKLIYELNGIEIYSFDLFKFIGNDRSEQEDERYPVNVYFAKSSDLAPNKKIEDPFYLTAILNLNSVKELKYLSYGTCYQTFEK